MKDYDGSGYELQPVEAAVAPAHYQPWPVALSSQPPADIKSQDDESLLFGSKPPPSFDAEPTTIHQYLFGDQANRDGTRLRRSVRWWLPEIIASALSFICLAVIVAVLAIYDQKDLPKWPLGITLNVFLAFFTSVAKVGLMVPVMEGLGQQRWNWFSRTPRRLADFELFDRACRSAMGSLKLFFAFKGGIVVLAGTLVIMGSLFTSPITQQLIDYPTRFSVINGTATVAQTTSLPQLGLSFLNNPTKLSDGILDFKLNFIPGAYTPPEKTLADISPICSSGDCSFPKFTSLGICTQVSNISQQLNVTRLPDRDWHFTKLRDNTTWAASLPGHDPLVVPNLRAFNIYSPLPGMTVTLPATNERNLSLADMLLVFSNPSTLAGGGNVTFEALEVLFYWCAKGYSISTKVARGVDAVSNTATSLNLATNTKYQMCMFASTGRDCIQDQWGNLTLAPPTGFESHEPLVVNELSGLTISALLQLSFWNGVSAPFWETDLRSPDPDGGMFMMGDAVYRVEGDISMALGSILWRNLTEVPDPALQFQSMRNMSSNMGKAIENYIRTSLQSVVDPEHGNLKGSALGRTPYVQIRWQWLSFLAAEMVLSTVFLVGTIVATRRARIQILKSCSLATMCALDESTRRYLGGIHDMKAVQDHAKKTNVRLERGVSGVAVWLTAWRT